MFIRTFWQQYIAKADNRSCFSCDFFLGTAFENGFETQKFQNYDTHKISKPGFSQDG